MEETNDLLHHQGVASYLHSLIGRYYKILPLCEDHSPTLDKYMTSLLREMLGCEHLAASLKSDDRYISLLAILQSLISDHSDLAVVRTDVFRAINILTQLKEKYAEV